MIVARTSDARLSDMGQLELLSKGSLQRRHVCPGPPKRYLCRAFTSSAPQRMAGNPGPIQQPDFTTK